MRWPLMLGLGLGIWFVVDGCGRGYEGANRSIIAELPALDDVELVEQDHYGYCSGDSCPLGNDRSGALLMYAVDTDRYTQDSLVEAYRQGLPGWEARIEDGCANADPSFCDEIVFASFRKGEKRIDLNLLNWPAGRFDLHVDAQGGARP